jgi:ATP-binding cassette subfamily B protein/ATP-binding cassette subfamily C protein LapB
VALDKVAFSLAPGERVGLLGRPGSGKSTLLRCMAGLGQPDAGQILIDGVALSDIAASDRARWLAYKAQDPVLFAATLDENLRVSGCRPESPRFTQALWASGLDDELRSGRMTLGMAIAERGANLSGGQRQKVALARVLAQQASILLLDEPTLGLDPDGERQFAERLPELLGDGVLVVSTHSVVLLSVVQRVIALDAGRIVADGSKERILRVGAGKIKAAG